MDLSNYYYLGSITRLHGTDGSVWIALDVDDPSLYASLKTIWIALNDTLIPFSLERIKIVNDNALAKFEKINEPSDAELLLDCDAYLPLDQLPKLQGKAFYYHEITGYTVIDKLFGEVGKIERVFDFPQQAVAQVFRNGKEVLIPLNLDLVTAINRSEKKLFMQLPEGLIELYLS